MQLRDYQARAVDGVRKHYANGEKRVLLHLATGSGKTVCFSYMLAQAAERGRRAIMVVRGKELVNQASRRLSESGVHDHGVMQGNHWNYRPNAPIQICSIDTLRARGIYPEADFVVIDECHYAGSKSFRDFINHYPNAYILSVSATPHVKGGLGFLASKVVYPISIQDLMKQGYLVRPRYFAVPNEIDRGALKIDAKTGDYTNKSAGEAVEKAHICGDAIKHYKNYGESRATIYFAVSVEASQQACRDFNAAGVPAAHIDAKTPQTERDEILASLEAGKIKVVTNCGVLTTGVDIPCLGAIILARPTASYNLYIQMCLDHKTEVLTKYGFKKYEEIKEGDEVASFDMENEIIEWSKAKNVFSRPLDKNEEMFEYKSPHLDFRVTCSHDIIIRTGRNHKSGKWYKIKAKDLANRKSEYSIPTSANQKAKGTGLTPDELFFIGFWVADGTIGKTGNLSITQAQHQSWIEDLRKLFNRLGFKFRETLSKGKTQFNETSPRIIFHFYRGRENRVGIWGSGGSRDKQGISRLDKYLDKNFSPLFEDMSREELGHFLSGLNLGDGSKQSAKSTWVRRTYSIACGRLVFAEKLQSLCIRRGYQCIISKSGSVNMLHIKDQTQRYIGGSGYSDRPFLKKSSFSIGESVWCLSTKHGTLITRRNGKVCILGNCGRGTRPYQGKDDFLVFDHAGNINDHGFIEHERRCSLEGKEPQETKVKTVTCEKCYAVFEPRKSNYVCRSIMNDAICGHDNTQKRNETKKIREILEDKTIELVEIKKIDKFYGAKNIIDRSIELIAAKNYRAGRLYYILQKKYGEQDGAKIWAKHKKYIYDQLNSKGWTEPPKVARSTRATDSAGAVSDGSL